jgi:hypothetical protein
VRRSHALLSLLVALAGCSSGSAPARPGAERLVYRVEDLTQSVPRVTTQVVELGSPQRARSVVHEGADARGRSLGGSAWSPTAQYLLTPDGTTRLVAQVAPQFAGAFLDLRHAREVALEHGQATAGPSTKVGGTPCTVLRTRGPVDSGVLEPGTAADHTDSCIAADGTLLREEWTLGGALARRRTLVARQAVPALPADESVAGATPAVAPAELAKDEPVDVLVRALGIPTPSAPLGLPAGRTAAVITPSPSGSGVDVEGGVFSWTDGSRLVLLRVERGLTAPLSVGSEGAAVRLGARTARVQAVGAGVRVRFAGPAGLVATVTGDVDPAALLRWAGALSLG